MVCWECFNSDTIMHLLMHLRSIFNNLSLTLSWKGNLLIMCRSGISHVSIYFKYLLTILYFDRYGLIIDEENAKTYLSFAVAIRFASGCISGLSSSFWANKFGRRKSLLLCQVFCILGAISSGEI